MFRRNPLPCVLYVLISVSSGAGAAGSSTAYHIRKYADASGVAVNITVFEKTDRIGGRTLTIEPFGNSSQRVELGASIFIEKNHILYDALSEFGFSTRDPDEGADPTLGIWDGDKFVFQVNTDHSFWWNAAKVLLKYGILAPRRTQQLMESTIGKFDRLYRAPYFPFRSLTQRTYDLGLADATGMTGEQFLKLHGVSQDGSDTNCLVLTLFRLDTVMRMISFKRALGSTMRPISLRSTAWIQWYSVPPLWLVGPRC